MIFAPVQVAATSEGPATQAANGGAACNTSGEVVIEAAVAEVEDNGNNGGGNGGADGSADPSAAPTTTAPTAAPTTAAPTTTEGIWQDALDVFKC